MPSLNRIADVGFRGISRAAATAMALLLTAGTLLAQAPAAPAAPGAPGSLPPAPVPMAPQAGIMEWGIVALMVGLAVFVVCKSSHRN